VRADFWERTDEKTKVVASLHWDGKKARWEGPKRITDDLAKSLGHPFTVFGNKPFDPKKHWDKLGLAFYGSRFWVVLKD